MFRVAFSLLITRGDGRKSCGPEPSGRRIQQDAPPTLTRLRRRKRILGGTGRGRSSRRPCRRGFFFRRPFSSRPGSSEAARDTSFTCALWDGVVAMVLRAGPLFVPKWNVAAAASRQFVCDAFLFPLRGKRAVLLF